ncbi:DUF2334 domain-containing protein [Clostridium sp.]|uniref:DUF2334 domain-containing protein n=1 Tax=Clostridium sp. TaxID=1506 RepID=UPI00338E3A63
MPLGSYDKLKNIADYLYNKGIPFIVVLMPVYFNTDLHEMKEFTDTVRYMQSRGGAIVLHSFLQIGTEEDASIRGSLNTEKVGIYNRYKKIIPQKKRQLLILYSVFYYIFE